MMESLNSYGRPFHQRGQEMIIGPLNPVETADMLRLEPAMAFDAALVTGGLPSMCASWKPGSNVWRFLEKELANPVSPLLVSAELPHLSTAVKGEAIPLVALSRNGVSRKGQDVGYGPSELIAALEPSVSSPAS